MGRFTTSNRRARIPLGTGARLFRGLAIYLRNLEFPTPNRRCASGGRTIFAIGIFLPNKRRRVLAAVRGVYGSCFVGCRATNHAWRCRGTFVAALRRLGDGDRHCWIAAVVTAAVPVRSRRSLTNRVSGPALLFPTSGSMCVRYHAARNFAVSCQCGARRTKVDR
jgi:hypothetical protein